MTDLQILILTSIIGLTLALLVYIGRIFQGKKEEEEIEEEIEEDDEIQVQKKQQPVKAGTKRKPMKSQEKKPAFNHPWLLTTLKGHSGRVLDLDFSENGRNLASCSEDRSVLIWFTKDFNGKEHKCWRGNVEYDHATKVKWSPDCKAYVIHKATANVVEVYKIVKGSTTTISVALTFDKSDETEVIGLGMASTGRYIMTCSDKTTLLIWSLKGEVLAKSETYHMNINYCAKISPCGRFVATSGFTPDVKVFEVKFSKTGEFVKIDKAFDLTGHTSGVFSFDFNADSSKMVTLSKDGTFRIYDTKVEFERGQDPSTITIGKFKGASETSKIALSPDSRVVAIANNKDVHFFSASDPETSLGVINDIHTENITALIFDSEGKYFATAGDKHIRVFHNVPGHTMAIRDLGSKLKVANTESLKERLSTQIKEAEKVLKNILSDQEQSL